MGCGESSTKAQAPQPASQPLNNAPSSAGKAGNKTGQAQQGLRPPRASKGKWSDLHDAAEENKPSEVRRLMDGRANPNAGDKHCWTPLLEAIERKNHACVEALLAGNADPNLADDKDWTPLMAAAEHGAGINTVNCLLQAGANPDFQDSNGWTCIMEAAEKRQTDIVQMLRKSGANLNFTDRRGWTALMAACEGGEVKCVKDLWIHGAEHNIQDENRWTALEEAKEKRNMAIVEFMQPIVDAERELKKMVDTDTWTIEEALTYLERAQQVWCLKGLVNTASKKLTVMLELFITEKSQTDPEYAAQCLDWLLNHSPEVVSKDLYTAGIVLEDNNANNAPTNASNSNNKSPEFSKAVSNICRQRLSAAASSNSIPAIKCAIASTLKANAGDSAKAEMDAAKAHYKKIAEIPKEWDIEAMVKNMEGGRMLVKKPVEDKQILAQAQALLDNTLRKKYTRDRRGEAVPDKLQLVKLVNVQNEQIYQEYMLKLKKLPAKGAGPAQMPAILTKDGAPFLPKRNANPGINETWLFHGTNQAAAEAITTTDFRLDLSGTSAGSMYGPGIYFSDSCSKADEYAVPGSDGLRCLILCRISLGRVLYDDAVSPDARTLSRKCISGEYDSILGDREKCRGTYKEFIIFDDDQAYPEFLLYYRRVQLEGSK